MKQQVVYIHGGSSYSNYEHFLNQLRTVEVDPFAEHPKSWKQTLAEDLGEEYELITPQMPNKYNAQYEEWKIWFERHFEFLRDDVILIGMSLGGMFLTKYLIENEIPVRIKALFLLGSVYSDGTADVVGGEDEATFAYDTARLVKLAERTSTIVLMHSKDDFVVPYHHAEKYKKALPEAELVTYEDKNHFLIEEFPELIEKIKSI